MATVLLIEDDPAVRGALKLGLELEGYHVLEAGSGSEGFRHLNTAPDLVDLIILDVMLPGGDGFGILQEIRNDKNIPVLMLTAMDGVEHRVKGLRLGADDYLVKPYALAEVLARLEALLRRSGSARQVLSFADLSLVPSSMQVRRGGQAVVLSLKGFELLHLFMQFPEQVLPKETLMKKVWGETTPPNTLEVHLSALRKALGEPPLLHTLRGHGYVLRK